MENSTSHHQISRIFWTADTSSLLISLGFTVKNFQFKQLMNSQRLSRKTVSTTRGSTCLTSKLILKTLHRSVKTSGTFFGWNKQFQP